MDRRRIVTDWTSGLPETPCGIGSKFANTEVIRELIPRLVETHDIRSIADVGCGDQNWIHHCLPKGVQYTGFDIKPRFPDVKTLDVTREILPEPFDLVLCIYVLNHVHPDCAEDALRLLKMSGSKFVLMSFSNVDEYALFDCPLIESTFHKRRQKATGDVDWSYGLWRMN